MNLIKYNNLTNATTNLKQRGFNATYTFNEGGIIDPVTKKVYQSNDLNIIELHRFEENSGDVYVIFALESIDNKKGLIISSYATYTDMKLVSFMNKVKIKTRSIAA